jgi:hypothetical protein
MKNSLALAPEALPVLHDVVDKGFAGVDDLQSDNRP